MNTANNTVLITGGTSGIGFALAQRFLHEGNTVIVTGTNAEKAEALKSLLPTITVELADLRDRQAIDKLVYNYSVSHACEVQCNSSASIIKITNETSFN